MKNKLLQIWYDMRHQPVIAWVTLIGTAMSIFLIMVVVMLQQVTILPFPPESCRDRLLVGAFIHTEEIDGSNDGSAGLGQKRARMLYGNLDGVEHTSYFDKDASYLGVKGPTGEAFDAQTRKADAEFFNIFDHTLIEGRYYTPQEAEAGVKVVVISESVARRLFGSQQRVGNTMLVDFEPYTVVGIVKDNSKLAFTGSGEVFIPTGINDTSMNFDGEAGEWGRVAVALLVKEGVEFSAIRNQVKARYAQYDTELAERGEHAVYHESPFDQETLAAGVSGSNVTPDTSTKRNMRYFIYILLLVVPAINLSTMLHSRMRRRVSEIGVRRAFGCPRSRIILDIITENLIVTLIGGLIGLVLGVVFAWSYDGLYDSMGSVGRADTPSLGVLLNWSTIIIAFVMCFILNLISAAVPAWQASRLNPVEAINAHK